MTQSNPKRPLTAGKPASTSPPPAASNPAHAELIAIREELAELRKELHKFRLGFVTQVASGVILALIVFCVLAAMLQLFMRF